MKNLAITDQKGKILFTSQSFEGKVHDKSILDTLTIEIEALAMLADLGFQGMEKEYKNAILPYKKPKKQELSELKKLINKGIAKVRVTIEHAFAGVKRLKIIRNKIRLKTWNKRHSVLMIAMALHNLRTEFYP